MGRPKWRPTTVELPIATSVPPFSTNRLSCGTVRAIETRPTVRRTSGGMSAVSGVGSKKSRTSGPSFSGIASSAKMRTSYRALRFPASSVGV
jgi:hypothetical protein